MEKATYDSPDWDTGGKIHNWKNYIPKSLRDIWDTFTDTQKRVLYEIAESTASDEEWP